MPTPSALRGIRYISPEERGKRDLEAKLRVYDYNATAEYKPKKKSSQSVIGKALKGIRNAPENIVDSKVSRKAKSSVKTMSRDFNDAMEVWERQVSGFPSLVATRGVVKDGEYTTSQNIIGNPLANVASHIRAQRQTGKLGDKSGAISLGQAIKTANRAGQAFQEDPDINQGIKTGVSIGFDPSTYGPGVLLKARKAKAAAEGVKALPELTRFGRAVSKAPAPIRFGVKAIDELGLKGFDDPVTALKFTAGAGVGSALTAKYDIPLVPEEVEGLLGTMGGGLFGAKMGKRKPRTGPKLGVTSVSTPEDDRFHHGTYEDIDDKTFLTSFSKNHDIGPGLYVSLEPTGASGYVEGDLGANVAQFPDDFVAKQQYKIKTKGGQKIYRLRPNSIMRHLHWSAPIDDLEASLINGVLEKQGIKHRVQAGWTGKKVLNSFKDDGTPNGNTPNGVGVLSEAGWAGMTNGSQWTFWNPNAMLEPDMTPGAKTQKYPGAQYPSHGATPVEVAKQSLSDVKKLKFDQLLQEYPDAVPAQLREYVDQAYNNQGMKITPTGTFLDYVAQQEYKFAPTPKPVPSVGHKGLNQNELSPQEQPGYDPSNPLSMTPENLAATQAQYPTAPGQTSPTPGQIAAESTPPAGVPPPPPPITASPSSMTVDEALDQMDQVLDPGNSFSPAFQSAVANLMHQYGDSTITAQEFLTKWEVMKSNPQAFGSGGNAPSPTPNGILNQMTPEQIEADQASQASAKYMKDWEKEYNSLSPQEKLDYEEWMKTPEADYWGEAQETAGLPAGLLEGIKYWKSNLSKAPISTGPTIAASGVPWQSPLFNSEWIKLTDEQKLQYYSELDAKYTPEDLTHENITEFFAEWVAKQNAPDIDDVVGPPTSSYAKPNANTKITAATQSFKELAAAADDMDHPLYKVAGFIVEKFNLNKMGIGTAAKLWEDAKKGLEPPEAPLGATPKPPKPKGPPVGEIKKGIFGYSVEIPGWKSPPSKTLGEAIELAKKAGIKVKGSPEPKAPEAPAAAVEPPVQPDFAGKPGVNAMDTSPDGIPYHFDGWTNQLNIDGIPEAQKVFKNDDGNYEWGHADGGSTETKNLGNLVDYIAGNLLDEDAYYKVAGNVTKQDATDYGIDMVSGGNNKFNWDEDAQILKVDGDIIEIDYGDDYQLIADTPKGIIQAPTIADFVDDYLSIDKDGWHTSPTGTTKYKYDDFESIIELKDVETPAPIYIEKPYDTGTPYEFYNEDAGEGFTSDTIGGMADKLASYFSAPGTKVPASPAGGAAYTKNKWVNSFESGSWWWKTEADDQLVKEGFTQSEINEIKEIFEVDADGGQAASAFMDLTPGEKQGYLNAAGDFDNPLSHPELMDIATGNATGQAKYPDTTKPPKFEYAGASKINWKETPNTKLKYAYEAIHGELLIENIPGGEPNGHGVYVKVLENGGFSAKVGAKTIEADTIEDLVVKIYDDYWNQASVAADVVQNAAQEAQGEPSTGIGGALKAKSWQVDGKSIGKEAFDKYAPLSFKQKNLVTQLSGNLPNQSIETIIDSVAKGTDTDGNWKFAQPPTDYSAPVGSKNNPILKIGSHTVTAGQKAKFNKLPPNVQEMVKHYSAGHLDADFNTILNDAAKVAQKTKAAIGDSSKPNLAKAIKPEHIPVDPDEIAGIKKPAAKTSEEFIQEIETKLGKPYDKKEYAAPGQEGAPVAGAGTPSKGTVQPVKNKATGKWEAKVGWQQFQNEDLGELLDQITKAGYKTTPPEGFSIGGGAPGESLVEANPIKVGLTKGEKALNALSKVKNVIISHGVLNNAIATPIAKEYLRINRVVKTQATNLGKSARHTAKILNIKDIDDFRKIDVGTLTPAQKRLHDRFLYQLTSFQDTLDQFGTDIKTLEEFWTEAAGKEGFENKTFGDLMTEYGNAIANRVSDKWLQKEIDKIGGAMDLSAKGGKPIPTSTVTRVQSQVKLPSAVGDVLNRAVDKVHPTRDSEWAELYTSINSMFRSMWAAGDLSFQLIQQLPLWADNPKKAFQATKIGMKAMFDPTAMAEFIARRDEMVKGTDKPTMAEYIKYGGHMAETLGEGTDLEGLSGKVQRIPGYGKFLEKSNTAFTETGNANRIMTYDMLWDNYKTGGISMLTGLYTKAGKSITPSSTRAEIIEAITSAGNRASGFSHRGLGGPYGSAIFFAPRFMQSQIELLMKAASDGGIEGHAARRQLIKMAAVGTGITMAVNERNGHDTEFDPRKPNFMRMIDINGADLSVFGPWDSLIRGVVKSAPTIDSSGDVDFDPTYLLRSKLAPVPSMLLDITTGKDIVGKSTRTPANAVKAALPFSLREALEQPISTTAFGLLGGKGTPVSASEQLEAKLEQAGIKKSDPDYLIERRQYLSDHPEDIPPSDSKTYKRVQEVRADITARRKANDKKTRDNEQSLVDFRDNRRILLTEQRNKLEELLRDEAKNTSTEQRRWLNSYTDLFDKEDVKDFITGEINPDAFDREVAKWTNRYGDDALDWINRYMGAGLTRVEQAYHDDLRTLDEAGYFDTPKYRNMKSGLTEDEIDSISSAVDAARAGNPQLQSQSWSQTARALLKDSLSPKELSDIVNSRSEKYANPEREELKEKYGKEILWFNSRANWDSYTNYKPGKKTAKVGGALKLSKPTAANLKPTR